MLQSPNCFQVCRWCSVFTELTWNLSIRSKATWAKSFLMLLAYRKQIIQNQRKTVRRAVTINLCWQKSSCELFPLATTHTKVANSGSSKMVIARYRICYFFQKRATLPLLENKLATVARYFSSSLLPSSDNTVSCSHPLLCNFIRWYHASGWEKLIHATTPLWSVGKSTFLHNVNL